MLTHSILCTSYTRELDVPAHYEFLVALSFARDHVREEDARFQCGVYYECRRRGKSR